MSSVGVVAYRFTGIMQLLCRLNKFCKMYYIIIKLLFCIIIHTDLITVLAAILVGIGKVA